MVQCGVLRMPPRFGVLLMPGHTALPRGLYGIETRSANARQVPRALSCPSHLLPVFLSPSTCWDLEVADICLEAVLNLGEFLSLGGT